MHTLIALLSIALAQDAAPAPQDAESGTLRDAKQLTFPDRFVKAGEAYFSPDGTRMVFQAIETPPEGEAAASHYSMFLADLGADGLSNIRRISPPGSANTCGWFDPVRPGRIIFGSTLTEPSEQQTAGYQRGTGKYRWAFHPQMRVVSTTIGPDGTPGPLEVIAGDGNGYAAECALSPDGAWLIFAAVKGSDADIYAKELATGRIAPMVAGMGYDGGPFFSPEGNRICYRSDRQGNDLLQVFVADVVRDASGAITGTRNERALTADEHVNWGPFWSPDGKRIVFASSRLGHSNYEVFEVAVPAADVPGIPEARRLTHAERADVLPSFDATGRRLVWTSQRGADGSSQLWIADYQPSP